MQGCSTEYEFNCVKSLLLSLEVVNLGGVGLVVQSARNYRFLRSKGVTVRKTIDVLIATFCIENAYLLLHNDRDFLSFEEHLGLAVINS